VRRFLLDVDSQYDPEIDPKTGIFRNRLGLSDPAELARFEYMATTIRLRQLASRPVAGNFDQAHLCQIHGFIFQDVYDWAGQLRTVETSSRAPFAKPEFIASSLDELLCDIRQQFPSTLPRRQLVDQLAWLYGELNAVHPSREGNGRAHCQFITDVARLTGWDIRWSQVTQQELDAAAIHAMGREYALLSVLLNAITYPRENPDKGSEAVIQRT